MSKNIKYITLLNVVLFLFLFATKILANECNQAIKTISKQTKIPHHILSAVALTETGTMQNGRLAPYPWAINVGGKGFLFSSKQKAINAVQEYLAQGKQSIDIGCMQLNWYWHKQKFNHSIEDAFDPLTNIKVGANYIQEHYITYNNWDKAVGRYHSGTDKFAQAYHQRYAVNLKIAQKYAALDFDKDTMTDIAYHDKNPDKIFDISSEKIKHYAGSLIEFKPADSKVMAFIDMEQKSLPIIDTRRKKPLF